MDISVIVPVFNAGDKIYQCVKALKRQKTKRTFEIIIVDDGSTDESLHGIQGDNIRVYRQANQGPASARNLGVEKSRGEIILFTDADCEPEKDWIEEMVSPLKDPSISGVKGSYLTRQRKVVARFVQVEYEGKYEKMKRDRHIDFIDTYSAGFVKRDFISAGKYDTRFPTACVEDQEFSFRMWEKGYRMVFNPNAKVYHTHTDGILKYMRKKFRIGFWKALVLKRHPGKIVRDSHTPQLLKFEMFFSMLFLIFLLLSSFKHKFLLYSVLPLMGFLGMISIFFIRALRRDPLVAFLSPIFLFLRAISLSAGLIVGTFWLVFKQEEEKAGKIDTESIALSSSQTISSDWKGW